MNPYEARRLARIIHKDRSKRIEAMLVKLAADGTLSGETDLHKVQTPHWVWCDWHTEVHQASRDHYGEGADACFPGNWRDVFIATTDPNEEF